MNSTAYFDYENVKNASFIKFLVGTKVILILSNQCFFFFLTKILGICYKYAMALFKNRKLKKKKNDLTCIKLTLVLSINLF